MAGGLACSMASLGNWPEVWLGLGMTFNLYYNLRYIHGRFRIKGQENYHYLVLVFGQAME